MARRRLPRATERGYVLITAIVLAILYFSLMQLMLMDSARELAEARRFKARVIAGAMAESGAELAAARMVDRAANNTPEVTLPDGKLRGEMRRAGEEFQINGFGEATGVPKQRATVALQGRIVGTRITIEWSTHSQ